MTMTYYVCLDCNVLFKFEQEYNSHSCPKHHVIQNCKLFDTFEKALDYVKKGESGEV